MRVLWDRGPSTVKEVAEAVNASDTDRDAPRVYTTFLTILRNMARRGLVTQIKDTRSHVFKPLFPPEVFYSMYMTNILENIFLGDLDALKAAVEAISSDR
jgi:predicted transcriptional regulator